MFYRIVHIAGCNLIVIAYEDFYPILVKQELVKREKQEWGLPALFKVNDEPIWALISEANITENNCATLLCNLDNSNEYKVTYPSARKDFSASWSCVFIALEFAMACIHNRKIIRYS